MMESSNETGIIGPYKATRMWNDVISKFRQYMPIGRHRRYMKTFDNCFSGSSAADWLHQYLKSHEGFGSTSEVSRQKAMLLLTKLYKSGIFEEVKLSRSMKHKSEIQENRLYRFLPMSPSKSKTPRLPLTPRVDIGVNSQSDKSLPLKSIDVNKTVNKSREGNITKRLQSKISRKISFKREISSKSSTETVAESPPKCQVMKRVLTTREIKDTWKTVFLQEVRRVLCVPDLGDLLTPDLVDGYHVMHNCVYLNKSGVVTNIPADDQLPHWVMSAMKCLARWPEPPEPGLPNYPGFEKDVFTVVKDYFLGLQQPLVPCVLYDFITNVFVMSSNQFNSSGKSSPLHDSRDEDDSITLPSLWTSASLENIILNLTRKYCSTVESLNSSDTFNKNCMSLEDLRQPQSVQKLRFDPCDDLRFAGHDGCSFNGYNLSAFPSTDGMDSLSRNGCGLSVSSFGPHDSNPALHNKPSNNRREGLRNRTRPRSAFVENTCSDFSSQPSIPEEKYNQSNNKKSINGRVSASFGPYDYQTLPPVPFKSGPSILSRTTQSASDAVPNRRSKLTKLGRKFDSTPNLKVSRYETAFGPHDKTVTRIYFQKGVSSERLNRLKEAESCSSLRETCFEAHPNGRSQDNSFDSLGEEHSSPIKDEIPRGATIGRSKSYVDLNSPKPDCQPQDFNTENSFTNVSKHDQKQAVSFNNSYTSTHQSQKDDEEKKKVMNIATTYSNSRSYNSFNQQSNISVNDNQSESHHCYNTRQRKCQSTSNSLTASSPLSDILESAPSYGPGYRHKPVLDAGKSRSLRNSCPDSSVLKHSKPNSYILRNCQVTSTPLELPLRSQEMFDIDGITPFVKTDQNIINTSQINTSQRGYMNFPQSRLSERRAKQSLQLVTLLLPPAARRKLHMLFKMMTKMTANPNLCLDPTQSTRSFLLGTFYRAILRPRDDSDFDEFVALQLVSFMLDFFDEIMSPSAEVKNQVNERLKAMQKPQMVFAPRPVTTFCQQVPVNDFENQTRSSSHAALLDLLDRIIVDRKMTTKEKKRRLEQFQRTYPDIYADRFPTSQDQKQILPSQVVSRGPKFKQPLITKPLSKLKNLRL